MARTSYPPSPGDDAWEVVIADSPAASEPSTDGSLSLVAGASGDPAASRRRRIPSTHRRRRGVARGRHAPRPRAARTPTQRPARTGAGSCVTGCGRAGTGRCATAIGPAVRDRGRRDRRRRRRLRAVRHASPTPASAPPGTQRRPARPLPRRARPRRRPPMRRTRRAARVPAPGRARRRCAKRAARRFLAGYLPYTYGRASAERSSATGPAPRRAGRETPARPRPARGTAGRGSSCCRATASAAARPAGRPGRRRRAPLHARAQLTKTPTGWLVTGLES